MNSDFNKEPFIYKMNFGQQIVCAAYGLVPFALILFFTIGVFYDKPTFYLASILFFLVPIIPIHINYLKEDNGKIIKIDYEKKIITIQQYGVKKMIQFDDIERIIINQNSIGRYYQWLNYKYAEFRLKDNGYFIVTRFTMNFDEETYSVIPTKSNYQFYPTIKEDGKKLI